MQSEPMRTAATARLVRYRTPNGLTLAAAAWGEPSAPPVLLLHGGGQTRHAWDTLASRLAADGYYAVCLDQRGHGESDWADDANYSLDAYVADTQRIVSSFDQPPILVGASLGGMVSLVVEGEGSGGQVRGIVLVDVAPRVEEKGVRRIVGFMTRHQAGFATLEEAADAIADYLPHRRRPQDLSGLHKNLRLGSDGRYRWHWDPRMLGKVNGDLAATGVRLMAAAKRLRVPVLLVRGLLSDVISREIVAEFLEAVPHARFVDVPQAGHMVAGDSNDLFADAVRSFLLELPD